MTRSDPRESAEALGKESTVERVYYCVLAGWVIMLIFNQDDNFARYIGQFGAEVAKGFASGGVP